MNKTFTKADFFTAIKAAVLTGECEINPTDIAAFCDKELAALVTKADKARARAAAKRAEGDALLDAVTAALVADEFKTRDAVTADVVAGGEDASVAKVGNRLTKLVATGVAEKSEVSIVGADGKAKKAMGYRLAQAD